MRVRARVIALYLPQFHPIPENDAWWGSGFTEWTHVRRARPLFPGHAQPLVPGALGYYDLRSPGVREAQAALAREHGIEAFCYYHYWFAGRELLEGPLRDVVASGAPDFPFCVCWANHTWRGIWYGAPNRTLIRQTYPGADDHRRHFASLLPAFSDPRYVRIDGRPLFTIFRPHDLPAPRATLDLWRRLAVEAGLPPLYIIGQHHDPNADLHALGFDASVIVNVKPRLRWRRPARVLLSMVGAKLRRQPHAYDYDAAVADAVTAPVAGIRSHPAVVPNWDNTARSGRAGVVLHDATPERFRTHLRAAVERVSTEPPGQRLIFVKSWNEWAEGNHLEPDERWGDAYLRVIQDEVLEAQ